MSSQIGTTATSEKGGLLPVSFSKPLDSSKEEGSTGADKALGFDSDADRASDNSNASADYALVAEKSGAESAPGKEFYRLDTGRNKSDAEMRMINSIVLSDQDIRNILSAVEPAVNKKSMSSDELEDILELINEYTDHVQGDDGYRLQSLYKVVELLILGQNYKSKQSLGLLKESLLNVIDQTEEMVKEDFTRTLLKADIVSVAKLESEIDRLIMDISKEMDDISYVANQAKELEIRTGKLVDPESMKEVFANLQKGSFAAKLVAGEKVKSTKMSWVELDAMGSSEDEDALYEEMANSKSEKVDSKTIYLPADLKEVYPKGYLAFEKSCTVHDLTIKLTDDSMLDSGLKHSKCYSGNPAEAKEAFELLSKEEQICVSTLKGVCIFSYIVPNEELMKGASCQAVAKYAMSEVLKNQTKESEMDFLKNSFTHKDGGRQIVLNRMYACFHLNEACAKLLVGAFEKISKLNAKIFDFSRLGSAGVALLRNMCFTTPDGMLNAYYKRQSRREKVNKEVASTAKNAKKGEMMTIKVDKIVHGLVVPIVSITGAIVTPEETQIFSEYSSSFNEKAKILKRVLQRVGDSDPLTPAKVAESVARNSYSMLKPLNDELARRKQMLRNLAVENRKDPNKISSTEWSAAREVVMTRIKSNPDLFKSCTSDELVERVLADIYRTYNLHDLGT